MAKLVSDSSMWTGSGSPPTASLAASWSAGSSIQASPVSVEKNTSGPMRTMRASCSAARCWMERTSRAYWKHAFVKQYEKFATFLRNEVCSNNLADFGLRKGLEHLGDVREKFLGITER